MTMSEERTAETGCVTAFDAKVVVSTPVAMARTYRRSDSARWPEVVTGNAIKFFLPRKGMSN
jgi:hypothetical protein